MFVQPVDLSKVNDWVFAVGTAVMFTALIVGFIYLIRNWPKGHD